MPVVELTTKLGHILYIIYYYIYIVIFSQTQDRDHQLSLLEVTHGDECICFGSLRISRSGCDAVLRLWRHVLCFEAGFGLSEVTSALTLGLITL